jgi:hypothetical protein
MRSPFAGCRSLVVGVGHLIFFADPAGNSVGAMQYDADAE